MINNSLNEFIAKIRERELISKMLGKYIASLNYIYKSLIFLYATSGRISIASFATVNGAPVGTPNAQFFSFAFSITT